MASWNPEGHIPPATVTFQGNRKIGRYQMNTHFLCVDRLYARKNALQRSTC